MKIIHRIAGYLHPQQVVVIVKVIHSLEQFVSAGAVECVVVTVRIVSGQILLTQPAEVGAALHTCHLVTTIDFLSNKDAKN